MFKKFRLLFLSLFILFLGCSPIFAASTGGVNLSTGGVVTLNGDVTIDGTWTIKGTSADSIPANITVNGAANAGGQTVTGGIKEIVLNGNTLTLSPTNSGLQSSIQTDNFGIVAQSSTGLTISNGSSSTVGTIEVSGTSSQATTDPWAPSAIFCSSGTLVINGVNVNAIPLDNAEDFYYRSIGLALGSGADVTVGSNSNTTITGNPGILVNSELEKGGSDPVSAQLAITGGTVQNQTNSAVAALAISQNDTASPNVEISGGTVWNRAVYVKDGNGGNSVGMSAITMMAKNGKLKISGGTVSGSSDPDTIDNDTGIWGAGVLVSGGTVQVTGGNVQGYGPYEANPIDGSGKYQTSGSGILTSTNATEDDNIDVQVSGGNITSQNGNAVQVPSNVPESTVDVQIDGGNLSGNKENGGSLGLGNNGEGSVTQGTFNPSLIGSKYLSKTVGYQVTGKDGSSSYFPQGEEGLKQATAKANELSTTVESIVVNADGTAQVGLPVTGEIPENSTIYSLDLSANSTLNYYNINEAVNSSSLSDDTWQEGDLNLSILPANLNIIPSQLTWTIEGPLSYGPISFTNVSGDTLSSSTATNEVAEWTMTSSDNYWQLSFTTTTKTSSNNNVTTTFSDLQLAYNGGVQDGDLDPLATGVYSLTVKPNATYASGYNNNVGDTIRFVISNSNTISSEITLNGTATSGVTTLDLSTNRSFTFGYTREIAAQGNVTENPVVVGGGNPSWQLEPQLSNGTNAKNYLSVNETTGLVTFLQPLPANVLAFVDLFVDGVQATNSPLILQTTGELSYTNMVGIAPIVDPVYTQGPSYDLPSNIVSIPVKEPVDAENLSFTSSDNNKVYVYEGNNGWQAYNMTSGNTSATITATYTFDNGTTTTTEFVLNFVSNSVQPNGLTVEEEINFASADSTPQNVNAALTPATTTQEYTLSSFTYSSSNQSIATVDANGNVYPISEGTCTVTTTFENYSKTTTINIAQKPPVGTTITLNPTTLYLSPTDTENGTTSGTITATLDPEYNAAIVDWSTDSDLITVTGSGMSATIDSTTEEGTAIVTASVTLEDGTNTTANCTVIVSGSNYVMDPAKSSIVAGGGSPGVAPDYFTVNAAVMANPAIEGADTSAVTGVTIFAWSQNDQSDINAKAVTSQNNGIYSQVFPVNDTPVNNYFLNASDIKVNVYASTSGDANDQLVWTPTWDYCTESDWTQDILVTTYSQNNGFNLPSVGENVVSGTTGQVLGMEGIRISTPLEGVDVNYSVYVKDDGGWQEEVGEGEYAGTMWQNKQIQGVNISLSGANSAQYEVQYQVHVSNIGWMDWVNGGTSAGDPNHDLQIEAIAVQIVPAGTALPSNQR